MKRRTQNSLFTVPRRDYLRRTVLAMLLLSALTEISAQQDDILPATLPPIPETPAPQPVGSVKMGDWQTFEEVQMDIPLTDGPFQANWASIEKNYPGTPEWLRDGKFGIWVHFGPQAAGESGDWYARNLYKQGHKAYENHLSRFGHPSEVGYKDVLRTWNPKKLDPQRLTALYKKAGARFLIIQGVHHDNFDLWNSHYQPWNSVNIGPHRDLLREWADACRKHGMRYGVTFHHEYTWWWWQTAFASDKSGEKAGVPYDGASAVSGSLAGEGPDARLLYGIDLREYESMEEAFTSILPKAGIFSRHLEYANWYATQWALRIMDVTAHYDPDFIYTDGTTQGPFVGNGTGTGYKCNALQAVMADYYNRRLKRHGEVDAFSIVKFRRPTNGTVTTAEFDYPQTIDTSQPWIREMPVGDWFYAPGFTYDSGMMIRAIIESVSRDGNVCINICLRPDGSLEDEAVHMLEEVGRWMHINGKGIYGSRAWKTLGEGQTTDGKLKTLPGGALKSEHAAFPFDAQDIRFTVGRDSCLYAFCMSVPKPSETVTIRSVTEKPKRISLLGYNGKLKWRQTPDGLSVTFPKRETRLVTSAVFRIQLNESKP